MKLILVSSAVVALALVGCQSDADTTEAAIVLAPNDQLIVDWLSESEKTTAPLRTQSQGAAPVSTLIVGLEERLNDDPGDAEGWTLLAQSYAFIGQMAKARKAADHAIDYGADADRVQALLIAAHSRNTGR